MHIFLAKNLQFPCANTALVNLLDDICLGGNNSRSCIDKYGIYLWETLVIFISHHFVSGISFKESARFMHSVISQFHLITVTLLQKSKV